MTTTSIEPSQAAPVPSFLRKHLGWITAKVPPHEMTDAERRLKKKLFAAVLVPTAFVILFMGELNYYTAQLAAADAEAARITTLAHPQDAKLIAGFTPAALGAIPVADAPVIVELKSHRQALRSDVVEPLPMCWLANCKKLKQRP